MDESTLDCPSCPPPPPGTGAAADKETWVCCSHCKQWYHCQCVQLSDPTCYSKWYCASCVSTSEGGLKNVERPPLRKSKRAKMQVDYAAIQEGMPADPVGRWIRLLESREFQPDTFRRMKGHEWTLDWLRSDPTAMSEPVLVQAVRSRRVKTEDANDTRVPGQGLEPQRTSIPGMLVPPPETTIEDVAALVGPDTPLEVIDVASQSSSRAWTLGAWAEYFSTPPEKRHKVLNVISLEVTGTPMQRLVEAPQLVSDLDWVTRDWPQDRRVADHTWPKVQRYVLMGVEGAYSDWHVDFAGSSVYYHVVSGRKTFLFAPPTPHNLASYRAWCSSTRQDFDWLGDHVSGLTRVDVHPGETMLIPSGWLHSVYTPTNTLVVGGNFLTDWHVRMQWKLVAIEEATKVPRKFRFPHLRRLTWYVAAGWLRRLAAGAGAGAGTAGPPQKVREGIYMLLDTLAEDLDLIDDDEADEKSRRTAKEAIPASLELPPHQLVEQLRSKLEHDEQIAATKHASSPRRRKSAPTPTPAPPLKSTNSRPPSATAPRSMRASDQRIYNLGFS